MSEEINQNPESKTKPVAVYESEDLKILYTALTKVQCEMGRAQEENKNDFFKNSYADLSSVIKCSRPFLIKHGFCVIQRIMTNGGGKSYLFTRLCHVSGQWIESRMLLSPTKADMQGMGSAITYARRYTYSALIGVTTGKDDDGNAACREPNKVVKVSIPKEIDEKTAYEYMAFLSESYAKPVSTVKEWINKSPEKFWKAFHKWNIKDDRETDEPMQMEA